MMKKRTKKLLSTLLALIMLFGTLPVMSVAAKTSGNLTYEVENGEAMITDCKESASGKLEIPSKLGGYPVTSIGEYAFYNCTDLESVIIPNSVTNIEREAFENCSSLENVTLSDSVESIGSFAFYNCSSIKDIIIPNSVTSIGLEAFKNCSSLENITLPDGAAIDWNSFDNTAYYNNSSNWQNGVLYIGKHLIYADRSFKGSCKIKAGTKYIAIGAFMNCRDLTSVTIPNGVEIIGQEAFEFCDLKSVTIPDSVKVVGYMAFDGCKSLKNITISDKVTSIGAGAFSDTAYYNNSSNWKSGLLYVGKHLVDADPWEIPDSCSIKSGTKCIAGGTFSGCEYMTKVTIPDSVVTIGDLAFYGCAELKKVTIPKSVTSIGKYAFGYSEDPGTLSRTKISGFRIYGYQKSAAQTYAKENGFKFIDLASHKHNYTSKVTAKATASKPGKITYTCTCGYKTTKSIAKISSVTLSATTYTYDGNTKKPTVTVKDSSGKKLVSGTDYTVKYSSGRKNVGKYTVTVTFKGKYSGTKKLTFKIVPKGTSVSKLTAGKKQFTVTWKKQATQTTGYQIQYSTSSKMSNPTTKTYADKNKTSLTVKNLKSVKTYYVRVRTYKNVKIDGKTTKVYSSWSKVKSVKTK